MDIITPIYGGRAVIKFNPGRHIYTISVPERGITNLWQPSVTGIIGSGDGSKSNFLIPWAIRKFIEKVLNTLEDMDPVPFRILQAVLESSQKAHEESRDASAEMGTIVHNFLEAELKYRAGMSQDTPLLPEMKEDYVVPVKRAINAGLEFFDRHKIKPFLLERPQWSPTYGYVGTPDVVGEYDGEPAIFDYKTSKRLQSSVFLQLAAGQNAYEEEFGTRLTKRVAVCIPVATGDLEVIERDNETYQSDLSCFLSRLTNYRWSRENDLFEPKTAPAVVGPLN